MGFINNQTPMYDSESQWTKVQPLYNTLSNTSAVSGKALLQSFTVCLNDQADTCKLQPTENNRNVVKHSADLCANIL